eukprot:4368446-Pyramimonas_sp.AAC.1
MESGWCSTCGSRLGAAHIRFKHTQAAGKFHGLRAGGFQHVALALVPHTFGFNTCKSFTD